ncbi:hypothetical protein K437DRAFT_270742 [Tilletiaria anomala UBC 951]|uniref:Uncharacterized protein n=1 Tax=Tilletiaria anomala (strain ATCC 24038 / CBS 436.72 / UBC 951) TaxID=1037660 RepID=A0A066VGP1_TILAU|nr:uncharacterized protein K437DRAFT_270742 [Tilletiaria anomala UBC 951]KDN37909.1 hypothetical protein K437DRAFT_270742 [Tilletiaria anomala UBC 951]
MSESFFDSLNFNGGGASQGSQLPSGSGIRPPQSQAIVFWKKESPSPSLQSAIGGLPPHAALPDIGSSKWSASPLPPLDLGIHNNDFLAEQRRSPSLGRSPRKTVVESAKAAGKRRMGERDAETGSLDSSRSLTMANRRTYRQRPVKRSRSIRTSSGGVKDSSIDGAQLDSTDSGKFIAYVNEHLLAGLDDDLGIQPANTAEASADVSETRRMKAHGDSSGGRRSSVSRADTAPPPGSEEEAREGTQGHSARGMQVETGRPGGRNKGKGWLRYHTDPHPQMGSSSPPLGVQAAPTISTQRSIMSNVNEKSAMSTVAQQSPTQMTSAGTSGRVLAQKDNNVRSAIRSMSRTSSKSSARFSMSPTKNGASDWRTASISPQKQAVPVGYVQESDRPFSNEPSYNGTAEVALAQDHGQRRKLGSTARRSISGPSATLRCPTANARNAGGTTAIKAAGSGAKRPAAPGRSGFTTPVHISRSPVKAPGSSPTSAIVIDDDDDSDDDEHVKCKGNAADDSFDFAEDEDFIMLSERLAEEGL